MKGVFSIAFFGLFMVSLNGCYTIVTNNVGGDFNQTEIIYYPPPPPPVINPIIIYPVPEPPNPLPHQPVINRPPDGRPKNEINPSYGVRDPLERRGGRGNVERTNEIANTENKSGTRR